MSDDKLSEKMVKSLSSFLKKTEIFEKFKKTADKTYIICFGIGIFSSISLLTTLISYYKINKKIHDTNNHINQKIHNLFYEIQYLEYITENNYFKDTILFSKKYTHCETQTDTLKESENINTKTESNESLSGAFKMNEDTVNEIAKSIINHDTIIANDDYDELSNECYDMIPCNNIKKHLPQKSFGFNIFDSYYT